MREEGSRQLEEEQRLIREQIQREREAGGSVRHICPIPEFSFVQFVPVLKKTFVQSVAKRILEAVAVVVSMYIYSIIFFFSEKKCVKVHI